MIKARPTLLLILLVLGLIFLQSFHLQAQGQTAAPVVSIIPSQTQTLPIGTNFTVYVQVTGASQVEGVQVQFTYDPSVLQCVSVIEGPFMLSVGQTIVAQSTFASITDTLYEVEYASAGISGNTASGSGILLNVTFTVISEGASALNLITYYPGGQYPGTYFEDINNNVETPLPNLSDGYYGSPVSLTTSATLPTVGQSIMLSGKVGGSLTGNITSVDLAYEPMNGNWTALATLPANGSGFFSYQWTPNMSGVFEFQISFNFTGKTTYSSALQIVVQPSLHGYGLYVLYALLGIVVFIAAASIVLHVRNSRIRSAEKPPT